MNTHRIVTTLQPGNPATVNWPAGNPTITRLSAVGESIAVCIDTKYVEFSATVEFLVLDEDEILTHAARHIGGGEVPGHGWVDVYRLNWWDEPGEKRLGDVPFEG